MLYHGCVCQRYIAHSHNFGDRRHRSPVRFARDLRVAQITPYRQGIQLHMQQHTRSFCGAGTTACCLGQTGPMLALQRARATGQGHAISRIPRTHQMPATKQRITPDLKADSALQYVKQLENHRTDQPAHFVRMGADDGLLSRVGQAGSLYCSGVVFDRPKHEPTNRHHTDVGVPPHPPVLSSRGCPLGVKWLCWGSCRAAASAHPGRQRGRTSSTAPRQHIAFKVGYPLLGDSQQPSLEAHGRVVPPHQCSATSTAADSESEGLDRVQVGECAQEQGLSNARGIP